MGPGVPPEVDRITVLAWPGLDIPMLLAPGTALGRAQREDDDLAALDSVDRCLGRAGISVTQSGDRWLIEVAGYGSAFFGTVGADEPVDEVLLRLLSAVSRGRALRYTVRQRRRGRSFPLLVEVPDGSAGGVTPREVGRLRDEDVSVVDGRRVVSRQRFVTVEAEEWVLDWVRHRLASLAMASQEVRNTALVAALGPPDPIPWPLTGSPDARTVIQRRLARAVGELLRHDPVVRLDLHVEGVHRMRVSTRVLRSLLRTFDGLFDGVPASVTDDLHWLSGLLGRVRDVDVLVETVRSTLELLPSGDQEACRFLLDEMGVERSQRLTELLSAMSTKRYTRLLDRLVELAEAPSFVDGAARPPERVLVPIARRTYRRLRRAAKAAAEEDAPVDAVHAVRLSAKRFRYVLDTVAEVIPAAVEQAKSVSGLQQVLGRFNDAVSAELWLTARAAREGDPVRAFLLGGLVMEMRRRRDQHFRQWAKAWSRVKSPARAAWLED